MGNGCQRGQDLDRLSIAANRTAPNHVTKIQVEPQPALFARRITNLSRSFTYWVSLLRACCGHLNYNEYCAVAPRPLIPP